jgi:hypothetical protein
VFLVLLKQGCWAEVALGASIKVALRWLVARRGKPLGPRVAVSQYDRLHLCRVGGVSLELQTVAESRRIEADVLC